MAENKIPVQLGNGCAIADDLLFIAGFPDELEEDVQFTRLFHLVAGSSPQWGHQDWPGEDVVSLCLRKKRPDIARAGCALSDEGIVKITNSSGETIERIKGAGLRELEKGQPILGKMRHITEVGKTLYTCGYGGQIYRQYVDGWRDDAPELQGSGSNTIGQSDDETEPDDADNVISLFRKLQRAVHLEAIGGGDESDVYCCGLSGQIYHSNGTAWRALTSPTGENLYALHYVSADEILIAGANQTLLRGNAKQGFSLIHASATPRQLYSVRKFQNEIYAATTEGLRRFDGLGFGVVRDAGAGLDETTVIQQIDSFSDEYLWIIGNRHVYRFDGKHIERYLHPDNI